MTLATQALLAAFFLQSTPAAWLLKDIAPALLTAFAVNTFLHVERFPREWFILATVATQCASILDMCAPRLCGWIASTAWWSATAAAAGSSPATAVAPAAAAAAGAAGASQSFLWLLLPAAAVSSCLKGISMVALQVGRTAILQGLARREGNLAEAVKRLNGIIVLVWPVSGALALFLNWAGATVAIPPAATTGGTLAASAAAVACARAAVRDVVPATLHSATAWALAAKWAAHHHPTVAVGPMHDDARSDETQSSHHSAGATARILPPPDMTLFGDDFCGRVHTSGAVPVGFDVAARAVQLAEQWPEVTMIAVGVHGPPPEPSDVSGASAAAAAPASAPTACAPPRSYVVLSGTATRMQVDGILLTQGADLCVIMQSLLLVLQLQARAIAGEPCGLEAAAAFVDARAAAAAQSAALMCVELDAVGWDAQHHQIDARDWRCDAIVGDSTTRANATATAATP
jgi:hypothetical protein